MKELFFLVIGMFTVGSSSFMIAGLLPMIGQTIGQTASVTGQGITAFGLTYLCSALFFSMIFSNRSAKHILQLALVIFLLGNLVTMSSENIFSFLLGRSLTGLGAGIFNPLCVSIAVELGGQAAKGRVLSLVWGANSAGLVFGIPFGIFLSSKFSWQAAIIYVFILAFISLIGFSLQKTSINLGPTSSLKGRLRLLKDRSILSVIGITCFTSMASLGTYSYVALIHSGASNSLAVSLFFWGLGGFLGSSTVGFFVDRTKNPALVMAVILIGLMLSIVTIPFSKHLLYLGPLSFFLWGAFGWATPTPQQHVLFELHEKQKTFLSALNSSAIGLGSSVGTAAGGLLIASGFQHQALPFLAAILLSAVIICQFTMIKKYQLRKVVSE